MLEPGRRAVLVTTTLVLVLAVGCGPAGTPDSPLPPRPRELPLDGVDPCTLLTDEQRATLALNRPSRPAPDSRDGPSCQFSRFPDKPDEGYDVGLYTAEPAAPALRSVGSRVVDVAGFGAVEARAAAGDPERTCLIYVDVAEGQHLRLLFSDDFGLPPVGRRAACDKARLAAELMVRNLAAQRGG